jgi:hypothetical protein
MFGIDVIGTGHFEKPPYNDNDLRSVYHIRELEVFQLLQVSPQFSQYRIWLVIFH